MDKNVQIHLEVTWLFACMDGENTFFNSPFFLAGWFFSFLIQSQEEVSNEEAGISN